MFPANIPGTRIARFVLCFALTAARPGFAAKSFVPAHALYEPSRLVTEQKISSFKNSSSSFELNSQ